MIVYSVTVLDLNADPVLGVRRTPAIFTTAEAAFFAVMNNEQDLTDGGTYQFAVIEKTRLNQIRPALADSSVRWWFRYNSISQDFEHCNPSQLPNRIYALSGFGIG